MLFDSCITLHRVFAYLLLYAQSLPTRFRCVRGRHGNTTPNGYKATHHLYLPKVTPEHMRQVVATVVPFRPLNDPNR